VLPSDTQLGRNVIVFTPHITPSTPHPSPNIAAVLLETSAVSLQGRQHCLRPADCRQFSCPKVNEPWNSSGLPQLKFQVSCHWRSVWCYFMLNSTLSQIYIMSTAWSFGKELPAFSSKSKLCYDRQSVVKSILVSGTHLGHATNLSFCLKFSLYSCGFFL
jgi:hypothetical protein